MLAAIRVRGAIDTGDKVEKTIQTLNLEKRNQCIILNDEDSIKGMLNKAKDYITFGEVSEETVEKLEERKGEEIEPNDTISLSPPTGGFKSTKKQVGQGGALGERDNMNDLIQKMV